jgi:site-specific recombinase XerD
LIADYIDKNDMGGYVYGRKAKRSWPNEKEALEAFLEREVALCNKTLDQITKSDFETYRDKRLASGIKPGTLLRELNPIRTILRLARKRAIPVGNPFDGLELPKADDERERILVRDERARLLKATETCRGERQCRLWRVAISPLKLLHKKHEKHGRE